MRKLKPIIAIILAVVVFMLSGCANIQALLNKNDSDFYELTAISKKADTYASIDISGDNILFLTASGIADYDLTVYNVQSNRITAEKSLSDCPLEYISGARFKGENEIFVYDGGEEKAVTYDLSLNQTGTAKYEVLEDHEFSSNFVNDTFALYDTYAFSNDENLYYFVFYDNDEKIYVFNGENEGINSVYKRSLFTTESKYSEINDNWDTTLHVKDVENALCINSMKLESTPAGLFNDVLESAISDKYVCFVERISNDQTGGGMSVPYLWKYTEAPVNEAFEVKSMTEDEILENNNEMVSEIESKYGVNILINKEPEFGYSVELGAAPLQINCILTALSSCLDLFPENFIKEIYQDAEYVEGLNIYIVDNINGATAFATDFAENYEIVFGYHGFGKSVIVHELMHLIDNRIQTYYDDNNMDFYSQWWALNPPDFDYFYDEDHDSNEEYFVSYYAMTNEAEDLADTFQAMYNAYAENGDYRFNEYEQVNKKAALICEAIRKAFPSMENVDKAFWEKYADFNN